MKRIRLYLAVGVFALLAYANYKAFIGNTPIPAKSSSPAKNSQDNTVLPKLPAAVPKSEPKNDADPHPAAAPQAVKQIEVLPNPPAAPETVQKIELPHNPPANSDILKSDKFIDTRLFEQQPYEETPYPKSFFADGFCVKTRTFTSEHNEPPDAAIFARLAECYPALERNPKDTAALRRCLDVFRDSDFMARSVPFFERFMHAGGDPNSYYATCDHYLRGLVRLGRLKEALERYEARWGSRNSDFYGQLYHEGFICAWIVSRNLAEMKRIFQTAAERDLVADQDLYYMQEVFCENFKRADAEEMPALMKHFPDGWVLFTPVQAEQIIDAMKRVGAEPPKELLDTCDALFKGRNVPAPILRRRAIYLLNSRDSAKALTVAEQAWEMSKGLDERFHALVIVARILRYREELERAFDITREATRVAEQLNSPYEKGVCQLMTAYLYEHLADPKTAIQHFDRLLEASEHNDLRGLDGSARRGRARAMVEIGAAAGVEAEMREWAANAKDHNDKTGSAISHTEWGKCLLKMGRLDDAIAAFNIARSEVEFVGSTFKIEISIEVGMELGLGRALLEKKEFGQAEDVFRRAEEISRKSQPQNAWWKWQLGLAMARLGADDRAGARTLLDDCIATIEKQRGSLKDFLHRRTLNDNKYEAFSLAVGLALDMKLDDEAFNLAERSRARAFLDELGAHGGKTQAPAMAAVKDLVKNVGDAALVSYYVLQERTAAWVVAGGKCELVLIPVTEKKLKESVDQLYLSLQDPDKKDVAAARALHRQIWAPIEAKVKLRPGQRVIIIPHGVLQHVPFQALHDGKAFLAEQHEICIAPSASAWLALRGRTRQYAPTFKVFDALLSNTPPFDKTETLELRRTFPDAEIFLPPNATLENFRAKAPEAGVLHLSCHGSFNAWLPLESGLQFNAAPNRGDGVLHAREVYGMHFEKTRLVVMSACASSVGELAGGDEVTGLARAFQIAGVNNVVGTLWSVENQATTELMQMFYEEFERRGHDPVAALTAAQRCLIARDPRIIKWAAFQVIGDGAKP